MGCIMKQGGGLYSRVRVGAILLAAGQGSRMGGVPKALIELQGVPLINRQLIALSGAGVDEVVVVTGYHHDLVEPLVEQFPVRIARNLNPETGQASSVRLGLEALGANFDAVIMALCDQPLINAVDIAQLIAAFKKRKSGEIILPMVDGNRGNPIVIGRIALDQMLESGTNMVCRKFMDQHPEMVELFHSDNEHFTMDVDSLEDLEKFEEKTGWHLQLPNLSDKAKQRLANTEPAYMALQRLVCK
ncbi:molybdenum cofactor cytidylyltransferase [Polynucleobacter sphagniphilus]|uniref:nucleotidyltransferase family protein n=1 Tax=Polynucleobacter sphagniphilus TaxID=1743169 RepID=UPI002476A542|nr:nucleotidyltransferase family protein [Polynucleobacter sphagniphilus]MDH6249854.1 molybdenum cofactor cytidylyltransferase [Polynucleobacter sphagniphilus]